jgi:integrase
VALLIANPLRLTQYVTLQFGKGTDENLYKDATGRWCMRFAPEHMKNSRFRPKLQKSRAYNVTLAAWVVPLLERYLEYGRPVLLKGNRSPYLLVGQLGRHDDMNQPFSNLDDRLQLVTARYIAGSPGFRAHAFRHIVATAWLKAHPRDYLTVARMLNDKLATVIDVYSHLEISDCLEDYSAWVKTLL